MKTLKYCWIFVTILLLVVLCYNATFVYPSADDFSYYAGAKEKGFWEFQKWHYLYWGGRYIPNMILGSFSFEGGGLVLYRFVSVFMVLGLFSSLWLFVAKVIKPENKLNTLYITSIVFIFYLLSLYSTAQQFYWMPGSVTYNLGIIFSLLVWAFWRNVANVRSFVLVLLGIFVINGTNEVSMLLFNASIVVILLLCFLKKEKISKFHYCLAICSIAFFLFSVLAPGNTVRSLSIVNENVKNISYAFPRSINRSFILIYERFYSILLIGIFFLSLPINKKILSQVKIDFPEKISFIIKIGVIVFPFFILVSGVFLSYYATGWIPPQRTVNTIAFYFMMSLVFSIYFYLSNFYNGKEIFFNRKMKNLVYILPLFCIVFSNNFIKVNIEDLVLGKNHLYKKQMQERIKFIKSSSDLDIEVAPIIQPEGISYSKLSDYKNHYYNVAYAKYYNKRSIIERNKK